MDTIGRHLYNYEFIKIDKDFKLWHKQQYQIQDLDRYYYEFGSVALKLSMLNQSKQAVECSLYFSDKYLIQNSLVLQRIQYWLCKCDISIKILKSLIPLQPDTDILAEIYIQLSNAYRGWCRYDKSEQYINKVQTIGPLSLQIQSNLKYLTARFLMDTGQSEKGLDISLECLSLRQQVFGFNQNHPEIALALELVGKLYFSRGDNKSAIQYQGQAHSIKMKCYGLYNFETIDSINEKGRILLASKKEKEAQEQFEMIGTISEVLLGQRNQYTALSNNNIGCVLFNLQQYEESIKYHQAALQIYENLCGSYNQKLYFSLNQIANANQKLKKLKIAYNLWTRCLDILQRNNPELFKKQIKDIKNAISNLDVEE
ncbi:Intracellular distribution of mitochondria [Paramecium bursaria]